MKTGIIAVIGLATAVQADIYVNNASGNNSNSGKSPDKAVKTIAVGMQKLYQTGDSKLVLAKTSSPYYETLRVPKGGTFDKPLVVEGNGATISGLKPMPAAKWEKKGELYFYPHPRRGALRPYLVIDGKRVTVGTAKLAELKPFSHYWSKRGVFFKPAAGKSINDYKIFGTLLTSGFAVTNSHYIICRNLTSEYFSNDGFNVHGNCQFLLFENIVGRRNGDDGFSVHEDVGSIVRKGHFYENDYGIQDVNASRSIYYAVLSENNRKIGVHFAGGDHDLINSTVRDNAMGQIKLNNGNAAHIGLGKDNEIVSGVGFLKDVVASGPVYGIHNGGTSKMTVLNSVVSKTPVGIMCDSKAQMTLVGVIVQDCSKAMIETNTGKLEIDYSILAPGNNIYQGTVFPAAKFAEWSKKCKVGKNMIYQKTDKIHEVHLFKEGRTKVYAGLRMPKR